MFRCGGVRPVVLRNPNKPVIIVSGVQTKAGRTCLAIIQASVDRPVYRNIKRLYMKGFIVPHAKILTDKSIPVTVQPCFYQLYVTMSLRP